MIDKERWRVTETETRDTEPGEREVMTMIRRLPERETDRI